MMFRLEAMEKGLISPKKTTKSRVGSFRMNRDEEPPYKSYRMRLTMLFEKIS